MNNLLNIEEPNFVFSINMIMRLLHYVCTGQDVALQLAKYHISDIDISDFDDSVIKSKNIDTIYSVPIGTSFKFNMIFTKEKPLNDQKMKARSYCISCIRRTMSVFNNQPAEVNVVIYERPIIELEDSDAVALEYYKVFYAYFESIGGSHECNDFLATLMTKVNVFSTKNIIDSKISAENYAKMSTDILDNCTVKDSNYIKLTEDTSYFEDAIKFYISMYKIYDDINVKIVE